MPDYGKSCLRLFFSLRRSPFSAPLSYTFRQTSLRRASSHVARERSLSLDSRRTSCRTAEVVVGGRGRIGRRTRGNARSKSEENGPPPVISSEPAAFPEPTNYYIPTSAPFWYQIKPISPTAVAPVCLCLSLVPSPSRHSQLPRSKCRGTLRCKLTRKFGASWFSLFNEEKKLQRRGRGLRTRGISFFFPTLRTLTRSIARKKASNYFRTALNQRCYGRISKQFIIKKGGLLFFSLELSAFLRMENFPSMKISLINLNHFSPLLSARCMETSRARENGEIGGVVCTGRDKVG